MATIEDVVNIAKEIIDNEKKDEKELTPIFGTWIELDDISDLYSELSNMKIRNLILSPREMGERAVFSFYSKKTLITETLLFFQSLGADFYKEAYGFIDPKKKQKRLFFSNDRKRTGSYNTPSYAINSTYFSESFVSLENLIGVNDELANIINDHYPEKYTIEDVVALSHEMAHQFDQPLLTREDVEKRKQKVQLRDLKSLRLRIILCETTAIFIETLCTNFLLDRHLTLKEELLRDRMSRHFDGYMHLKEDYYNILFLKFVEKHKDNENLSKAVEDFINNYNNSHDNVRDVNHINLALSFLKQRKGKNPYSLAFILVPTMYKEYCKDPKEGINKFRKYLFAVKSNNMREALEVWNIDFKSKEGRELLAKNVIEFCERTNRELTPLLKEDINTDIER
jgi:hypothetical protein